MKAVRSRKLTGFEVVLFGAAVRLRPPAQRRAGGASFTRAGREAGRARGPVCEVGIDVDAWTMEANVVLRLTRRRAGDVIRREVLRRLARATGVTTPDAEDVVLFDW